MSATAIVRRAGACICLGAVCLLGAWVTASVATAHSLPRYHSTRRHHRWRHHGSAVRRHRTLSRDATHGPQPKARTSDSSGSGPTWSATAPCANADTPATSASVSVMVMAVDCLINQERLQFGLPVMDISTDLNSSAQGWTDQMVSSGAFEHGSDTAFSDRLLNAGFNWGEAGEDIATGYLTPRDVVAGWMASPDHCQNILDPDYREMGTGENPAPVGNWASGAATWTQDLGLLMHQNPLSHNYAPESGCPYTIASSPAG